MRSFPGCSASGYRLELGDTVAWLDLFVLGQGHMRRTGQGDPVAGSGYQLRRRYVARWAIPRSSAQAVVVIEEGKDGWRGVTAFAPPRENDLDNQARLGRLAYSRPSEAL